MLGPFHATKPEDKMFLMETVRKLSAHGERIYVCEGTESKDDDYPMLDGHVWWYMANSHDACKRHIEAGIESGIYSKGMLIGMAMDGDWMNQLEVIQRRAWIGGIAKELKG